MAHAKQADSDAHSCWAFLSQSWSRDKAHSECFAFLRPKRRASREGPKRAPPALSDRGLKKAAAEVQGRDLGADPGLSPGTERRRVRFAVHHGDGKPPSLPDLGEACRHAGKRRATLYARSATVTCYLFPPVLRALCDYIRHRKRGGVPSDRAVAHARRVRVALQELGPAFVKLGQAVAAREDVLSTEVSAELRKLCDQVPPFAVEEARALLKEELEDKAPKIGNRAIAAASLGQVYRVTIQGKDYAVKVQRPGIAAGLAVDVVILRGLARFTRRVAGLICTASIDLVRITDAWAMTLWHELDYLREAASMDKMRDELCGKIAGLVIPDVCWDLTSLRVLTTEWVHGAKVTDGCVGDRHIAIGVEAFAAMILEVGCVHADPHAGNLIITNHGRDVCLLDFGMVIEIPPDHRRAWAECVCALVCGDHEATLDSLVKIGFFPEGCPRSEILPVMSKIWTELVACGSNTQMRKNAVRHCHDEILILVRKFNFDLPDYYIVLVRALLTLEGIALSADCEFDIFKAAFPVARRSLVSSLVNTSEGRQIAGAIFGSLAGALSRRCCRRAPTSMRSGTSWQKWALAAGVVGLGGAVASVAAVSASAP